jgi:hypothetical protein
MYAPHEPPPGSPLVRPQHLGAQPSVRSSIPKVIGILAIVFSSLGLLGSLAVTFGMEDDMRKYDVTRELLGGFGTWMMIYMVLGLALFGVHLAAGILSVKYSSGAPSWMTFYGIAALALVVADVAVSIATFPKGHGYGHKVVYEAFVYPRLGLAVLAVPWPIIALVMMNQRSARMSCAPRM